jgi:GntR family transcriptional regulator
MAHERRTTDFPSVSKIDSVRLVLDHESFVPYYEQIVDQVRSLIREQKIYEGQTFLSEGEISRMLGISKMPVRQAFQKLRLEGSLVVSRGKMPIIGSGKLPWNFQQLRGFSEEMKRRGLTPSAKLLSLELREPDNEVASALKLQHGESVYWLKRLRFVDNEPMAVVTSYLPAAVFPELEKQDLEKQSLYHIIEQVYKRKLHWAEEIIGAATVRPEEGKLLQATAGSAVLLIKETTYDSRQTPIEYSVSVLRGDRYTASVVSVRRK